MNFFEYFRLSFLLKPYIRRYRKNLQFTKKREICNPAIKDSNQRKKVLVCMHSFEWGGAERFAYETIKFLKDNDYDFLVFVEKKTIIADYFLDIIAGASIVYAEHYQKSENQLVELIARQEPNIIYIHHSWSTYNALKFTPRNIFIIDSLHIVEYQTGGYPYLSAKNSCYINIHHVVSQGLKNYLVNELGVASHKIEIASLERKVVGNFKKRKVENRFVIGFLGRFEKQKRPELFIELARALLKRGDKYYFIMQGDGSLYEQVSHLIKKYNLQNIEISPSSDNITNFYQKIDILVSCSENEGLTLVGIESVQHDTIFISTDVGQQNEIVSDACLVSPHPLDFIQQSVTLIQNLVDDTDLQKLVLENQQAKFVSLTQRSFRSQVLEKYL